MDVYKFVSESIKKKVGDKADNLNEGTNLQDIGLDSLHITQLVAELEDAYSVELTDDEVQEILTATTFSEFLKAFSRIAER